MKNKFLKNALSSIESTNSEIEILNSHVLTNFKGGAAAIPCRNCKTAQTINYPPVR